MGALDFCLPESFLDGYTVIEDDDDMVLLDTPERAVNFIKKRMDKYNYDLKKVSELSGVDIDTLNKLMNKEKVTIPQLDAVYDSLNIRTDSYPMDLVKLEF